MLQVDLCRKRQNAQQEHTIIIMLNMCPHFMQEKKLMMITYQCNGNIRYTYTAMTCRQQVKKLASQRT